MIRITAVVLSKNEEQHIAECLGSLAWCGRVLVLDSGSSDRTVEIAREMGVEVHFRAFDNFANQRNAALEMVSSKWVLFVDADERVSAALASEIQKAINNQKLNGYQIPTHNYQNGRLVLNAGMFPDYHLRLFKTSQGHYDPNQKVHEIVMLQGQTSYLKHPLIHISCETWSDFINHQKQWARMKAQVKYDQGQKPGYHYLAGPLLEFHRRYIALKGYRDGLHGLYLSLIFAYFIFAMYWHLGRLWRTQQPKQST
jgi:glycosyltransferase involved in cell wall biosynthesis